ncbi:hypothetical protein ACQUFE_17980, partial [Enterococcus casseliflavus]|uniref:hypothetical protein n=1 Tax=Enterococcus casseliflavus TaxID=37734 RepID=UPI003D151770
GHHPIAVTNRGTMTFTGGAGWHGVNGGRVTNASTGVLTFGAGTAVEADCCSTPAAIVNSGGTVNVPAGAGTVTLDNTGFRSTGGTVDVG